VTYSDETPARQGHWTKGRIVFDVTFVIANARSVLHRCARL